MPEGKKVYIYEPKLDIYMYTSKCKPNSDGIKARRIFRFFPKTEYDWQEFSGLCLAYNEYKYWYLCDLTLYYSELKKYIKSENYTKFSLVNLKTQFYNKPIPCAIVGVKDFKSLYCLIKKCVGGGFPIFLHLHDSSPKAIMGEGEWDLGYKEVVKRLNVSREDSTLH